MSLLTVTDLVRQFDVEPVLNRATFDVRLGDRIGLVGPNGAGKTTLLRILVGLDHPDSGQIQIASSSDIVLLEQHPDFAEGRTLIQEAREGLATIYQLQRESDDIAHQMAGLADSPESQRLHKRYDFVQHELQRLNGFQVDHRIDEVLQGLGFDKSQYDQPLTTLSGGQQNRVLLARMLLRAPELMLLDEPTNHLDIAATQWLEQFLIDSGRTMIVVSHDRYFLDRICTRILEQHRGKLTDYPGNFSKYWQLRHERQAVSQKTFEKQQEYIEKTEEFIRRNKSGQLSKQAKDREQKLARVEVVDTIADINGPAMGFSAVTRTGDWVVDADGLTKGFVPGQPLFSGVTLQIKRGERWGILGPNGAGKTTLLRTLLGELKPDAGRVRFGTGVNVAYFDQQLSSVDPSLDAMEAIRPPDVARYTDGQLRDLLAKFGVKGDLAIQQVGAMSGGERSKVALAKIAALQPNVLVLDEPTNHLDLWSRDALEMALKGFDGTLLFVSHDRYFLDQVADHVLVVEPGSWATYEGNYSDYVLFLKNREAEVKAAEAASGSRDKAPRSEDTRAPRETRRKRMFPYRKVADIEAEIADKEEIVAQCEANLVDVAYHRDAAKMKANLELYESTKAALVRLYEHWEEAVELN
jgi:ATP-binding cassette subfamily F protein 3